MLSKDVESARLLATHRHQGQVDKSGKPYILHPTRVAERMKTPEEKVVGWLHNIVEDTGFSLLEIEQQFGPETAEVINAINRRDNEPCEKYLVRVKENRIARSVKISVLMDNSNLSRLDNVTLVDIKRQEKYNHALQFLLAD